MRFALCAGLSVLLSQQATQPRPPEGQTIEIGIIDFFGLGGLAPDRARAALTFKEGDAIPRARAERAAWTAASEARIAEALGISRARIELVCCANGRAIAFVGIEQRGLPAMQFRPAPAGNARLAPDIVQDGAELWNATMAAVQRGEAGEDRSRGHALNADPAMRAIQDRFVVYAKRDLPALRRVLRESADAAERALAAQVLGYAPDKSAIVDDLVHAMTDPSEGVRNDAMRALLVIAEMAPSVGDPPIIPSRPFIALLTSPVWTDRNKTSGALMALTARRDPPLLEALKKDKHAVMALAEMARWKSLDHAQAPFFVLARLAGYSDEAAFNLWTRGEREAVIKAAIAR